MSTTNTLDSQQRQILLKGALYVVKSKTSSKQAYLDIANWITLEDMVGDKELSFRISLTIPNACNSMSANTVESLLEHEAIRMLHRLRTSFYVWSTRGTHLGKDAL